MVKSTSSGERHLLLSPFRPESHPHIPYVGKRKLTLETKLFSGPYTWTVAYAFKHTNKNAGLAKRTLPVVGYVEVKVMYLHHFIDTHSVYTNTFQ